MSGRALMTMVAVTESNKKPVRFTVMDSHYQMAEMSVQQVVEALRSGSAQFTNLAEGANGTVVSSNGAINKYPTFDGDNAVMTNRPSAVVLNRIEIDNKLAGYTMFMPDGTVSKVRVADAVALYSSCGIANGKVRHTAGGDIISSINGEYPIMEVEVDKAEASPVTMKVVYISEIIAGGRHAASYAGVVLASKSANKVASIVKSLEAGQKHIAEVNRKACGDGMASAIKTIRMSAASYFVVVDMKSMKTLLENVEKQHGGNLMVSCIICSKPGEYTEVRANNEKTLEEESKRALDDGVSAGVITSFKESAKKYFKEFN